MVVNIENYPALKNHTPFGLITQTIAEDSVNYIYEKTVEETRGKYAFKIHSEEQKSIWKARRRHKRI